MEKEKVYDPETGHYGIPKFIEPGDYQVSLYGKGRFTGKIYEVLFRIVRSEEAAQSLIDEAQEQLKQAQEAFAHLNPDDPDAMQQLFADLFAAQNALTDAQNELARTRDILNKEQVAEKEDQIAQLEDQIEDLNNQLAEVSVVDISNYAVTMKTTFPYTGKAIKPAVKISGLNESCYEVSYENNTKIGTARVIIKAKGEKYKGTITKTFKIVKAANPLKIKGKTATVKYSALKKKAKVLAVTEVISFVKKASDKKTYKYLSAKKGTKSFRKYFRINTKTGKVTVKKGLKKGTYKVRVKVKAAGNANYKASFWKTVTFTVGIK